MFQVVAMGKTNKKCKEVNDDDETPAEEDYVKKVHRYVKYVVICRKYT